MSRKTNEPTRREWRELGFFYALEDQLKMWRLVGSRAGLGRFAELLRNYVSDPKNAQIARQLSYGPYLYLKITTAAQRGINGRSFHGSLDDLTQLASIVDMALEPSVPGQCYEIHQLYARESEYALVLDVRDDGFDPASADRMLPHER